MQNGLIHVYIGDGKGKTTAAFGLALRCYGCGGSVQVLQFLKTWNTGEADAIRNMNDARFSIKRFESEHDLVFDDPTEIEMEYLKKDIQFAYRYALDAAKSGKWDVLVLDEILWALYFKMLTLQQVIDLMLNKSSSTELVLTGRYAPKEILNYADYITEMQNIRHPYDKGIDARKYIEF